MSGSSPDDFITHGWQRLTHDLERLLKLRSIPFGMKLYEDAAEMEAIPCFAERRYGGVLDDQMLMTLPPEYLHKAIDGMNAFSNNGLRYPFSRNTAFNRTSEQAWP